MAASITAVLVSLAAACASAQEADRLIVNSRAAEIEAQREAKRQRLQPDTPSRVEYFLQWAKDKRVLERITTGEAGFRARLGGLITGSGFAVGPEYYRRSAHDDVIVRASARGSFRRFYILDAEVNLPRLAGDHAFAEFSAARRNYPSIDYYGPGPGSSKSGRTDYLREDTTLDARAGIRATPRLRIGGMGRYLFLNIGPGRDAAYASADRVYGEAAAPGIHRQSNYAQAGPFVQYDYRDKRGGARSGGYYSAEFAAYSDRTRGTGSFRRLDLEAQQYIPLFNRRRVIALRGKGSFTDPRSGQFVPFYLQPTLGGSDDLRGFRTFRFHDNNAIVMNAEYRWEVFSGMDMALFYDTGKVFGRWRDASLDGLKRSYGFGMRFNVRNEVFLRLDTGFSREGFQVWVKFGSAF